MADAAAVPGIPESGPGRPGAQQQSPDICSSRNPTTTMPLRSPSAAGETSVNFLEAVTLAPACRESSAMRYCRSDLSPASPASAVTRPRQRSPLPRAKSRALGYIDPAIVGRRHLAVRAVGHAGSAKETLPIAPRPLGPRHLCRVQASGGASMTCRKPLNRPELTT